MLAEIVLAGVVTGYVPQAHLEVRTALDGLEPAVRDSVTHLFISERPYTEELPPILRDELSWRRSTECDDRYGRKACRAFVRSVEEVVPQGAFQISLPDACLVFISGERLSRETVRHEALHCLFDKFPEQQKRWTAKITIDARREGYCLPDDFCDAEQFFAEWYATDAVRCPHCKTVLDEMLSADR